MGRHAPARASKGGWRERSRARTHQVEGGNDSGTAGQQRYSPTALGRLVNGLGSRSAIAPSSPRGRHILTGRMTFKQAATGEEPQHVIPYPPTQLRPYSIPAPHHPSDCTRPDRADHGEQTPRQQEVYSGRDWGASIYLSAIITQQNKRAGDNPRRPPRVAVGGKGRDLWRVRDARRKRAGTKSNERRSVRGKMFLVLFYNMVIKTGTESESRAHSRHRARVC